MSATYNSSLPTERDWVRLNIGDRNVLTAAFSNEEIDAVLTQEKNKWLAAAVLGDILLAQRKGLVSRSCEDISISYGDSPQSAYREHIQRLRETGCRELLKTTGPHSFRSW